MSKQFPKDFVWGVATASYQIEGAAREGGRGESIWDRYCAIPGNVQDGDTGDVACDHYHLFREDVELMRRMGVKAYRFSIAWPRVLPQGRGEVNEKGMAFYSELVDALLEAGIEPYVTLYHWDLPQALQDIGGWANHEMPEIFLAYAKLIFERLGGRVKHFITLNEPYCAAFLGHYEGRMAPGLHDFSTAVRAAYHMYVGHGMVVKAFRESGLAGEIGIALNLMGRLPLTDKPEDIEAARRARREAGLDHEVQVEQLMMIPGVVAAARPDAQSPGMAAAYEQALRAALDGYREMREHEGAALKNDLESRERLLESLLAEIEPLAAEMNAGIKARLLARLEEEKIPVPGDDERLLKEVLFYADKADVTEEITRLHSHFGQFRRFLAESKPVGRSLDFLMQEMFREITTLGNKAGVPAVSPLVVAFKSELEKLREQIQNVE